MQLFHMIRQCNAGLSGHAVLEYGAHLHFHKKRYIVCGESNVISE